MSKCILNYLRYVPFVMLNMIFVVAVSHANQFELWSENSDNFNEFKEGGIGSEDLSSYSELRGDNNLYNNSAEVEMNNTFGSNIYIKQKNTFSGDTNKAKVIQNESVNSDALIIQKGAGNTAFIVQKGNDNEAYIVQLGLGHEAIISQYGNRNKAVIKEVDLFEESRISISQAGNGNEAYILDGGGSSYGISQNGNDSIYIIGAKNLGISVYSNN